MSPGARIAVLACLLPAAGCGGVTKIVPLEDGRYQMSVYTYPAIVGSGTQLLARAWREADDLCVKQGRSLRPTPEAGQDPALVDRSAYAQVNFRCVDSDPAR